MMPLTGLMMGPMMPKKEPAIAEAATAKPAAAAAEEKKTSPPRVVAEVGKANPPKKSPTRPAGDSNTQTPARKNPPPRKNVKEEPNQWSKPHSSWEPKESWEDGWDDGWDDGWGDWSYEKKGWNLDQKNGHGEMTTGMERNGMMIAGAASTRKVKPVAPPKKGKGLRC